MSHPLVSVIMPVYCAEAFVRRAMCSVLAQSYPAIELVIVNDASPDGSEAVIKRTLREEPAAGRRSVVYRKHADNGGSAAARMTGLAAATGEYVLWLDSDDYFVSTEVVADWVALAEERGAAIVYSDYYGGFAAGLQLYRQAEYRDGDELLRAILRGDTPAFLPTKLIRRAYIPADALVVGQNILEDVAVLVYLLVRHRGIGVAHLRQPTICYVQYNETSLMTTLSAHRFAQIEALYRRVEGECLRSGLELRAELSVFALQIRRMLLERCTLAQYGQIRALLGGGKPEGTLIRRLGGYDAVWLMLILRWEWDTAGWLLIQTKRVLRPWLRRLLCRRS